MWTHTSEWGQHMSKTPTEDVGLCLLRKPGRSLDPVPGWLPDRGKALGSATLTQWVSFRILNVAKGAAVPFLPWGSLTLSLHMGPLGDAWGSFNSSTIFCTNMTAQPRQVLHESLDRLPEENRPTAHCLRKNEQTGAKHVGTRST